MPAKLANAKDRGAEQLVCSPGLNEDGTQARPPDARAINGGLLPANRSIWAALIPGLLPDHFSGGLTVVDPASAPAPTGKKGSRGKKPPPTITDRAKPEAPIADEVEVAMLWDRVSALTAPRRPEATSLSATPTISASATPMPKGSRQASKAPQQSPSSPRSTLSPAHDDPIPFTRGPPSEASVSQSFEPHKREPTKPRAIPPPTPPPKDIQIFNPTGLFEGGTATGGIYTVSYPGAVTASTVQPPSTVVASRSTAKSSANNQAQQPILGSTYVAPTRQSDRPVFASTKGDGKTPQIGAEMVANYGNVNAGASDAKDVMYYTFSYPHAVAAGPHTGSLPVPVEVPSGISRKGVELSAPGIFINMLGPTMPRLMSDEMVSDRPVKIGPGAIVSPRKGSTDFGPNAGSRIIPRPPIRPPQDGTHPERLTAAARNKTAEWGLKVAQEALSVSTERKAGHTLLILYEREQAKREKTTIDKRVEDLNDIYTKATEAHRSSYSIAQQRFDTELYQRHNELNEALQSQPYVEECIADELATTEAIRKAEQQLIDEIREHGIALKTLAQEHLQERAQLMATMTNKLKRTFEEMKTVTATQRTDRLGRAHTEAARLGKELSTLDKTNRSLTAKLVSIKAGIATAIRDLDLEQQSNAMHQAKFERLNSKVAAAVSDLRGWEKGVLEQTTNSAGTVVGETDAISTAADALESERGANTTLKQQVISASEEREAHEKATATLRSTLLDRLQWLTKSPAAYDVVQGLTQMLAKGTEAPEPNVEGITKALAPTEGLLVIGAVIQETLEEVLGTILGQQGPLPIEPQPQAQITDSSVFKGLSQRSYDWGPSTGGSRRSHGSTLALPQLRYSSSAFVFREVEGSVQILSLEPSATPNHASTGVSTTGEEAPQYTPKPTSIGSPLDISSAPGTPRGGARHVRISEQLSNVWLPQQQRPLPTNKSSLVAATVPLKPAGTSISSVRSLLDIADPTEKRLIQDFIVKRINRKLSRVLPTAPAGRGTEPTM